MANEEEVTVLEDNHGVNGNGVPVIYLMNGHSQNGQKAVTNGLDGKNEFVSKSLDRRAVAALNKFGENAKMMSVPLNTMTRSSPACSRKKKKMMSDPMWLRRLQPAPEPTGNIF